MPQRSPDPHPRPWWLHGGTEECPHCGQRYHLETERRCPGCDAPGCAHCMGKADQLCPACTHEGHS